MKYEKLNNTKVKKIFEWEMSFETLEQEQSNIEEIILHKQQSIDTLKDQLKLIKNILNSREN